METASCQAGVSATIATIGPCRPSPPYQRRAERLDLLSTTVRAEWITVVRTRPAIYSGGINQYGFFPDGQALASANVNGPAACHHVPRRGLRRGRPAPRNRRVG
jgi:hypothetical protein